MTSYFYAQNSQKDLERTKSTTDDTNVPINHDYTTSADSNHRWDTKGTNSPDATIPKEVDPMRERRQKVTN